MNGVISPGPGEDGKIFFRDVSHHITWQMANQLIQLVLSVSPKAYSSQGVPDFDFTKIGQKLQSHGVLEEMPAES